MALTDVINVRLGTASSPAWGGPSAGNGVLHQQAVDWLRAREAVRQTQAEVFSEDRLTVDPNDPGLQEIANSMFSNIDPVPYQDKTEDKAWPKTDQIEAALLKEIAATQGTQKISAKAQPMSVLIPLQKQRAILAAFRRVLLQRRQRKAHLLVHTVKQLSQEEQLQKDAELELQNKKLGQQR